MKEQRKQELELFDINNPEHMDSSIYEVVEYDDVGLRSTYSCYIDGEGSPQLQPFGSEETDEPNGVEVRFPVKSEDFSKFCDEAETVYRPFAVKPNVTGNNNYVVKSFEILLQSDTPNDWELVNPVSKGYRHDQIRVAVQGNIEYPINTSKIVDLLSEDAKVFIYEDFRLHFDIGDLDIAASREELGYDKITIENIVRKFEKMASEIRDAQNKKIDTFETKFKAMQYIQDLRSTSSIYREISFQYKGEDIETSVLIDSTEHEIVKYHTNGRTIRREPLRNDWRNEIDFSIPGSKSNMVYVLADEEKYSKSVKKARSLVEYGKSVYLFSSEDTLELLGNPEFKLATEIELPVSVTKRVKGKFFKKYWASEDISRQYSDNYETADRLNIDLDDEFFYTEIKGNKVTNGKNIHHILKTARELELVPSDFQIIGISAAYTKTKAFKEVQDNGIEAYDYIVDLLKNSAELKDYMNIVTEFRQFEIINSMNSVVRDLIENKKVNDDLGSDHIISQARQSYRTFTWSERSEIENFKNTMNHIGLYEETEIVPYNKILEESYPLLFSLNWNANESAVIDYIKGQDLLKKLHAVEDSSNDTENSENNITNTSNTSNTSNTEEA